MTPTGSKPINLIAEMEQLETMISNVAQILGEYYKTLLQSGFDEKTAKELVIAFQGYFWQQIIGSKK